MYLAYDVVLWLWLRRVGERRRFQNGERRGRERRESKGEERENNHPHVLIKLKKIDKSSNKIVT